jgi:hypothetical protein
VPVETLRFHEKVGIREIRVEDTDTVVWIYGGNQAVPGIFDCFHMSWRDEAGSTDKGELHNAIF